MKSFTKPQLKNFIYHLINFCDEVDEKGNHLQRKTFAKEHYRAIKQIKDAILNQLVNVYRDNDNNEIAVKITDEQPKDLKISQQKHTDAEIELNESQIRALKYLYKTRDEIPEIELDTLNEFEELVS